MLASDQDIEDTLRQALEAAGHRYTEQRAAVYRFLAATDQHPTADDVFLAVRNDVPAVSLATVYKNLETLVGCGLAMKLTYGDGSARYDGRTDPHHHARCLSCARIMDLPGDFPREELKELKASADGFKVTGYRFELTGYCSDCELEGRGAAAPV